MEQSVGRLSGGKASACVCVRVDAPLRERVRNIAERKRRSANSIMKEAIEKFVDAEERRAAFQREVLESMRDYEETGLHLTLDEIKAWMDECSATGKIVDMPVCHV
ncbi:MAG: ribbon-helix-helix domain-containing protein [Betaproteobacteria bacterium]|nr:ribbon-helix-helix domain-containing protein [Betaproteobacteria bacterium]